MIQTRSYRSKPAFGGRHVTRSSQLGDALSQFLLNYVWGTDWDKAVTKVHERVTHYWADWWCSTLYLLHDCIEVSAVDQILKCYTNLAAQQKIPEYSPNTTMEVRAQIIQPIEKCSGYSWTLIHQCLYELYRATKAGEIANGAILNPYQAKKFVEERKPPAGIDSREKTGDQLSELFGWLKWIAIFGGVALAAYYLWLFIQAGKAVTPGE